MRPFFFQGDWGLLQCVDCLLLSGLYSKIQVSSHVVTYRKKSVSFSMFFVVSAQQFSRCSFCLGVRIFDTTLVHTIYLHNSSCKNLSNTFLIDVGNFRHCSNAQSVVSSNNSSERLHIFFSFCIGRTARF